MNYDLISCGNGQTDLHSNIQIALANIPVLAENIEASYLQNPILSRARFAQLTELLNNISKYRTQAGKKIDLVIFPEVSIPYSWELMLTNWARQRNVGVVCGLEHRVTTESDGTKTAYNEILAVLPFQDERKYKLCAPVKRLKRIYSPEEKHVLNGYRIDIPRQELDTQQLIQWRGASFAIYNCYELCSLEERATFKGKVDFIICTEYNRDVNYFSNIAESTARDLHCYFIQVNDCRFGDSRVIRPSRSEIMNPLRIKGGDNLTFLTLNLNLKALRDHQLKGYELHKDSPEFKPLPPDYCRTDVENRINLGKKLQT
jgi:hypothetical protein